MELLLKHHVDVDGRDGVGATPLFWASYHGQLDVVRVLLRHGASVDQLEGGREFHGRRWLDTVAHGIATWTF